VNQSGQENQQQKQQQSLLVSSMLAKRIMYTIEDKFDIQES
jgi:hypothetical protein